MKFLQGGLCIGLYRELKEAGLQIQRSGIK
jgi:hypothetical protein